MNRDLAVFFLFLSLIFPACNAIRHIPGFGPDTPPAVVPDIYTVVGTTRTDHDIVSVRVAASSVVVRVNRQKAPLAGWHECDQFEVFKSTLGAGGGYVHFGTLNFVVGGVTVPVAPAGTPFEITTTRTGAVAASLY